jgi:transposase-like protein
MANIALSTKLLTRCALIKEIKSLPDVWRKMPSEHHARVFLEDIIWGGGRYCPHCGSVRSIKLVGKSSRPGLYQCCEAECRGQFTITTKTPLHANKLDLRIWISAIFIVITSSRGISSVVMARLLGVNQKTAWKMGHAIRELMDDRNGELLPLEDIVEVDEAYVLISTQK